MYNTESNQWTVIAPMRSRRSGIGVIAYGEHVYAVSFFRTTKVIALDFLLADATVGKNLKAFSPPWKTVEEGGMKSLVPAPSPKRASSVNRSDG